MLTGMTLDGVEASPLVNGSNVFDEKCLKRICPGSADLLKSRFGVHFGWLFGRVGTRWLVVGYGRLRG